MKELLEKIYEDVLINEDEVKELRKEIDETVKQKVLPYKEKLTNEEIEELSHLLFSSNYIAEKVGFEVGIWFMLHLISSKKKII